MADMASKDRAARGPIESLLFLAKLSKEQVQEIRRRLVVGERCEIICREYGVSRWTVMDIRSKRTWAWLPD
jgi:hypothetical protein